MKAAVMGYGTIGSGVVEVLIMTALQNVQAKQSK